MADIERVLTDPDMAHACLLNVQDYHKLPEKQARSMLQLLKHATDMATTDYSAPAYAFVLSAWHSVFIAPTSTRAPPKGTSAAFVADFLELKDRLVHLIINRADYAAYDTHIRPLYAQGNRFSATRSWADTLATTLAFLRSGNVLNANTKAISSFLRSSATQEQKRLMVATYVRKALLYNDRENFPAVLSHFLEFQHELHSDLLFLSKDDAVYTSALRLIALPPRSETAQSHIERICRALQGLTTLLSNFLTALTASLVTVNATLAVEYWEHKCKLSMDQELRTPRDLALVMEAHLSEKKYDSVLKVYGDNEHLHTDSHIELLLQVSQQCKDWKLLQKQFEDMYGKGNLPYVVHYGVVMSALASIGVTAEVEELYEQLVQRKLKPSAQVFAALIRGSLNAHDTNAAEQWFEKALDAAREGAIESVQIPKLQAILVESMLTESTVSVVMNKFHELLDNQKSREVVLVDAELICRILRFLSSTFAVREIELVLSIAKDLNIADDSVYSHVMSAFSAAGQHERVAELAFEAHLASTVPFTNALIIKAEIANYRAWSKANTNSEAKRIIAYRIDTLLHQLDAGKVSPRNIHHVYTEAIKYCLEKKDDARARSYLDRTKALGHASETHYLAFIRHNARLGTYNASSEILKIYREMASDKVAISARTYRYLIGSVINIDTANRNNYANAYNLMQSVLDIYGFSDKLDSPKVAPQELANNASDLLSIVTQYALAAGESTDEKSMRLVVQFLDNMRKKLQGKVSFEFRVAILKQMAKVYLSHGDIDNADSLIKLALRELQDVADYFKSSTDGAFFEMPKMLQLEYRALVDVQMLIWKSLVPTADAYMALLQGCSSRNIRLSGQQFNTLCMKLLRVDKSPAAVDAVLSVCEKYLVVGNWIELKIKRKVQYIYKLFILDLSNTLSREEILSKYKALNAYYNTTDFKALRAQLAHVRNTQHALQLELHTFKKLTGEHWELQQFFDDLPTFFAPGRQIPSQNVIGPSLASVLTAAIEHQCNGDIIKAFALYDRYPEVMEYLLYYGEERTRLVRFQKNAGLGRVEAESRRDQRERTIETLHPIRNTV